MPSRTVDVVVVHDVDNVVGIDDFDDVTSFSVLDVFEIKSLLLSLSPRGTRHSPNTDTKVVVVVLVGVPDARRGSHNIKTVLPP